MHETDRSHLESLTVVFRQAALQAHPNESASSGSGT